MVGLTSPGAKRRADETARARASRLPSFAGLVLGASLAAAAPAGAVAAKPAATTPAEAGQVRSTAVRSPIQVDGALTEDAWTEAQAFTRFLQKEPVEGARASLATEVRVVHDGEALYVGARLSDPAPDSIVARLARRDDSVEADLFGLYLDPYHDRRSGYYFMVNAAGTLYDGTLFNDDKDDDKWDAVWEARARRDAGGWTVEMRIPLSQLRFHRDPSTWGINFVRKIARLQEEDYAVYTPRKESGFVSRFPELVGLAGIRPTWPVEVMPFASSQAEFAEPDAGDPFHDGMRVLPKGGLDLRAGIGRGLTFNGTVNPDFGQVEVDPDKVNLTEFETFFDEKRPFFTEGAATFEFGREGAGDYWDYDWEDPLFFYSRRIGRTPQASAPKADFDDVPEQTTILGAGKLLGRLTPHATIGLLHAVTGREQAKLWNDGVTTRAEVEPQSQYGVLRAQVEFGKRRAGLGSLATWSSRTFSEARVRDVVNAEALLGGLDGWYFLDDEKVWVLSGWAAASRVEGTAKRMIALQRSSARYFQRPDAGHVDVDSSATSLEGYGHRLWLNKQKGAFRLNAAYGEVSPGFELNDLGFQRRADWRNGHLGVGWRWSNPTRSIKYQTVKAGVFGTQDHDGTDMGKGLSASGYTEWKNRTNLSYYVRLDAEALDPRKTRGGPLMVDPARTSVGISANAYDRRRTYYYADLSGSWTPTGSWDWAAYLGAEWKPSPSFSFKVVPGFSWFHGDASFVTSSSDASQTATFGRRYVFGTLDQLSLSNSMRINWIFQPTLSLQCYISPYLSSVRYRDFKLLVRPRSYDFTPYAHTGNPDFISASLKGNTVLRWEYRPGSALYAVWTQKRSEFETGFGEFLPGRTFGDVLLDRPENVFLVKLSYHIGS
jgi:hypothetical protein